MLVRPLSTLDEFRMVLDLEMRVWGYTSTEDAVPVPLMVVTARTGGLILGAFDECDRMVGMLYSQPSFRHGRRGLWSHMTAVLPEFQGTGVGWALKREQRRLALLADVDLIEWTFDPLQALNAHFNFRRLGVIAREYERDVYGDSASPLHLGTATDRFVAEWRLRAPQVEALLESSRAERPGSVTLPPLVNAMRSGPDARWLVPGAYEIDRDEARLGVAIPMGFSEMQQHDLPLAREWRHATRAIFEGYLSRGYEVADFALDRPANRGIYIMERPSSRLRP